jgi:hypothetical protein
MQAFVGNMQENENIVVPAAITTRISAQERFHVKEAYTYMSGGNNVSKLWIWKGCTICNAQTVA